jgi:hypothetical protein
MGDVTTEFQDEILHLVAGPRIIVAAWRDAPTMVHMKPLWDLNAAIRRRLGDDHVAYANVVLSGTPLFSSEVREEVTALSRDYGSRGIAQANLILLEGFAGTAVRAFLSTMNLIARTKAPVKVFGTREETEHWLLERLRTVVPGARMDSVRPSFDAVLADRVG